MSDNEKFMVVEAWKQKDFLCKVYILSALEDDLYNVYSAMNTSKELWDALEKKYKTEDACLKRFVVAKFLDYKMIDIKTVGTQVQELQLIFHDLIAEGMVVNEAFQVAAMIEKLPHSWRDFKNHLKHKRKEMKLEDLVIRLRIEEDNKTPEKKSRRNSTIMGANIVEEIAPKKAFATYSTAGPEEEISMGNNATAKIEGYGKIFLKVTFGKVLTLNNVLHVPTIRKNLVCTSLLVKKGFKCVFISDKVVVSKNEMPTGSPPLTWGQFTQLFLDWYIPPSKRKELQYQFDHLEQERVQRFVAGLHLNIRAGMARKVEMGTEYQLVVEIAHRIEGYRQRGRE
uniref:Uncharacterized protein LOC104223140 n=1 Tax=Nicotiana sylvestris TaxID=4096 RepID=A0A1U7VYG2_NICSY|nr:PREDICTED: uncharacterized protein LOC104223140 [Nicotiana sylvestris]